MNLILERVNTVCKNVRENNTTPVSFKKIIGSIRKEFKENEIDLSLKTKKDTDLENAHFYVLAFYDADDDFNNETPIEVIVHHNFKDTDKFQTEQTTELLVQIFDAVVHELRHRFQSAKRNFQTFSDHANEPYSKYLADPDELDAYAFSIAIEILRALPLYRAKIYMTRLHILSKMKQNDSLISPNLRAYVSHFHNNALLKRLSKKVYKHLETLDRTQIFQ